MFVSLATVGLAGQYAIDFVMPILAQVGGEAHNVHRELMKDQVIQILFYEMPNFVFLGMMLNHAALFRAGSVDRIHFALIILIWITIIAGNILSFDFVARFAILALGLSLVPVAARIWPGGEKDVP